MSISPKVLEQHIAILGKTGSGKTYTAKGIAERLLTEKRRVCIVDPTGVWWGLRSDSTGKRPAFPIVVFGGEHADVALGRQHGGAIAEIIGTTDTSAVLDTRLMTVGERTRFFADFGEALLRKNKGPLHLILDEAHLFAPQGRVNDPQSGKMLHAANNLVSLGRGVGLRIVLISQRPAKLHKDSLTQAETLIAMRLIAPQDRNAVEDWIGEWADPKQGREILASLPSLPTGEGWLWSPEIGILEKNKFPKIRTYDSSRAPDGETGKIVLANIDLPTIQTRLEAVAHEAFENDPKRLRAKIAELERTSKAPAKSQPADPDALKKEFDRGVISAKRAFAKEIARYQAGMEKILSRYTVSFEAVRSRLESTMTELALIDRPAIKDLDALIQEVQAGRIAIAAPTRVSISPSLLGDRPAITPAEAFAREEQRQAKAIGESNERVSGPQQRILDALAWLESIQIETASRTIAAYMADVSPSSSGFEKNVSTLRTAGLIAYPQDGALTLTNEGRKAANWPEDVLTDAELHRKVMSKISGPQGTLLKMLIANYPEAMSREELAVAANVSANSSGFEKNVSTLRSIGLVDYPEKGSVVATKILFI